jgi:subtilisin family serine protease
MANAISVGATDASDSNAPGSAVSVSSRGPALISGLVKPNVSAPGASIRSSIPGSTYQDGWTGTSAAAPHVAGEVALIWSAQPELRGDVQLTQWIIEQNTSQLLVNQGYFCGDDDATSVPNNQYGWGRIDAYDAVDMAVSDNWDIPWLAVNPTDGFVVPSGNLSIELAFDTAGLASGACYLGTLKFEYNDPFVIEEFLPVEMCVCTPAGGLAFTWLPTEPGVGETVHFVAAVPQTGTPPFTYIWDFGDGFGDVAPEVDHVYDAPKNYVVQLMVENACGGTTLAHTVTVADGRSIYLPLVIRNH